MAQIYILAIKLKMARSKQSLVFNRLFLQQKSLANLEQSRL